MRNKDKILQLRTKPELSRGRLYKDSSCDMRNSFQRDRDRIIHASAFRRLVYKTQVFVNHEGDHYRTRLTHSLEVAQMARSLARLMGINEELAEAIALSHDLGHTAFGHAGEDALNECMQNFGGFDHNAQTIRILTKLEKKYAEFDGLNLTWETLEGAAKHNGPILGELPRALLEYNNIHDLELHTFSGVEAQVAGLSDDIAYNSHDIDDGLRAGLITIDQLKEVELVGQFVQQVQNTYKGLEDRRLSYETSRRLVSFLLEDVYAQTLDNIEHLDVCNAEQVRAAKGATVSFSSKVKGQLQELKSFLMQNVYRAERVEAMVEDAHSTVKKLFEYFMTNPHMLPPEWQLQFKGQQASDNAKAVNIADYIAGMTDRYAKIRAEQL